MNTRSLNYTAAIKAIQAADIVVLDFDGSREIATFIGYAEEGDPASDFLLGADGCDDVHLSPKGPIPLRGDALCPEADVCICLFKKVEL